MAAQRASLSIDIGPNAAFDTLAAVVSDLREVLDFAHEVQAIIDRNDAAYSVLRRRDLGPFFADFDLSPDYVRSEFLAALITSGTPFVRSAAFERAVEQRLTELAEDRIVRVDELRYVNPLDIHFHFDGGGIARILEIIRDWPARRREAAAKARAAEARANSYEEDLRFKRELHDEVLGAFASEEFRISRDEIARLLTASVQQSLGALVRADPVIELQDESNQPESQ
jgi:hypothetical protein